MYKLWRSPYSNFSGYTLETPDGDLNDETIKAIDVYTDEVLKGIKKAGFNAVWVHGILRHIVRVNPFPELGKNSEKHLAALLQLTERAAKHDIKVFIHIQPPRAVPLAFKEFWEKHPDVAGEEGIEAIGVLPKVKVKSLCTSTEPVKEWLVNAMEKLVSELPLLAGVTVITASEFHAHCYTRKRKENPISWAPLINCPRCRERKPEEVAAELISLLCKGAHKISRDFAVIAWNWGWEGWNQSSCTEVIRNLPAEAILMVDFERGGIKDIPGRKKHLYDEYSLSYGGPSQRFMASYKIALERGINVMAKLQLGTTHELGSVVSLPILGSLFEKAVFFKENKLAGFMGCWNFGNMLSANTEGFNYFLSNDCPVNKTDALELFASRYFPGCNPLLVRTAWETFEKAMEYFPFSIAFLYHGAHSHTLAYKEMYIPAQLTGKPAGRSWMPDERGDELANSYRLDHTEFSCSDIVERVGKLAAVWQRGIAIFDEALNNSTDKNAQDELGNAMICGSVWKSTENTYKIYQLRQKWDETKREQFFQIVENEIDILASVLPLVERDERQGYHAEPHFYMFNAEKIRAKIKTLEELIKMN